MCQWEAWGAGGVGPTTSITRHGGAHLIHDSTSTSAPRECTICLVFFSLHALCCLHAFLDDTLEPFIMRP